MRAGKWMIAVVATASLVLVPVAQAKRTATVYAGPPNPAAVPKNGDLNGFFRRNVTVRRGKSVTWRINGFHTVTFVGRGARTPAFAVPDARRLTPKQNDAAGNPFWFGGQPSLTLNAIAAGRTSGKTFNGRGLRNSGLPLGEGPPKPYKLRFTRSGRFTYQCLVHPDMRGTVRVVGKGRPVPSRKADSRAARRESGRAIRSVKRRLAFAGPVGPVVFAGNDSGAPTAFKFFPTLKQVAVGGSLTLAMHSKNEVHTFTFGPAAYRKQVVDEFEKGLPVLSARAALPSDPPPGLPDYTGQNHGNGFLNTGFLDGDPSTPLPDRAVVRFTKAGSYQFQCMIHPNMLGTVQVG